MYWEIGRLVIVVGSLGLGLVAQLSAIKLVAVYSVASTIVEAALVLLCYFVLLWSTKSRAVE